MVRIAGGRPRFVKTSARAGYKLAPEQLEKAIRPRTKVLVLNYPSNPTGAVYSAAELRALGEVALAHGLWIVADEMYERMVYTDEPFASLASLSTQVASGTSAAVPSRTSTEQRYEPPMFTPCASHSSTTNVSLSSSTSSLEIGIVMYFVPSDAPPHSTSPAASV